MMNGPEKTAMAVRRPNGEIYFEESVKEKKQRPKICRLPLIRGVFGFIDSMAMGYKYLMKSAEISLEEEPAEVVEKEETTALAEGDAKEKVAEESTEKKEPQSAFSKATITAVTVIATVLGVLLAVGLFVWLPTFIYSLLEAHVLPQSMASNRLFRSVFEGLFKIAILVLYMALVSLMKDIRRTFMYHGAEHKTIFCYENGLPLTVENVKKQRRFHPRCGTSFLILMLLVSIVVGLFIPVEISGINGTVYTVLRTVIKLLLIPVIMGVGYELLKLAGKHDNILTRIISAPGLWLQRITVREPDDGMIECAIKAFLAVMPREDAPTEAADAATKENVAEDDTNGGKNEY